MKYTIPLFAALALLVAVTTGCLTSRTQTVSGGVTNTIVTVNAANLALDSAGIEAVTSIAVSTVVAKDPSVIPALKNAKTVLDGILNGSSPQTTAQVLAMLQAQNNASLSNEITSLVSSVSTLEQNLLAKYGESVAGQISVALTKAISAGLAVGLAGK